VVHRGSFGVDGERQVLRILLEIWVFMRWCEDLLWNHSDFAHKSQLCSSLKVEFLQYPSHSLLDFWYGSSARISSTWS
jgi:hypothetical protein